MRIAVGSIMQESNTFSPLPTTLREFEVDYLFRGEQVLSGFRGARVTLPGMVDVLAGAGAELVPLIATHACSGGPVTREAFDTLLGELIDRLRASLPVDAVCLSLHGAMCLEDDPDADGAILAAVRGVVGPGVPIAASLDLHGHITQKMLQHADILVGFKCYPHTDMYETGERTAQILLQTLRGEIRPVLAMAKRHMIFSPNGARTIDGPFKLLMDKTHELEREGKVLVASLFTVQPWLDIPDLGFASLVMTNGDPATAQRVADQLAGQAWSLREEFDPKLVPLAEAIRLGRASEGLTVIGDTGDAPSGGAPGDSTAVLRELLAQGVDRSGREAYLTLIDPEAVQACMQAGIGAEVTLAVGHKVTRAWGEPLTVTGKVRTLSDGHFRMKGPAATGMIANMGRAAVLAIGSVHVLLTSKPATEWDYSAFLSVGLDPREAALVFVKSPSHFRVAYTPIAGQIFNADTPGPTCGHLQSLPFKQATRPLFPIDANEGPQ